MTDTDGEGERHSTRQLATSLQEVQTGLYALLRMLQR